MPDFVPETAIDSEEVFRRGGRNFGDEDFAHFKCPSCDRISLLEYEVETVYVDRSGLSAPAPVYSVSFECVRCRKTVPTDEPCAGPKASTRFYVTWAALDHSDWAWISRPEK